MFDRAWTIFGCLGVGLACGGGDNSPDTSSSNGGDAAATAGSGGGGAPAGLAGEANGAGNGAGSPDNPSGGAGGTSDPGDNLDPVLPGDEGVTLEQLLEQAPLVWGLQGTLSTWGELTFVVPPNWTPTVFEDAVELVSPGEPGQQCGIEILAPRAAAADEAGRFQQLLEVVQTLFPGGTNETALDVRTRGISGSGFEFVGLELYVGPSARGEPYLAIFGEMAVPVVPFGDSNATCWSSTAAATERLEVFHSLSLAGFEAPPDLLGAGLPGVWFTGTGEYAQLLVLDSTGKYGEQLGMNVTVPTSSNVLEESFSSWPGDAGDYGAVYNLMFFFPAGGAPYSRLLRTYDWSSIGGPWQPYLCMVGNTALAGENLPYESCFRWVAD